MADTRKLIGGRIKELRKLRKISQEELSELISIDPKHLSALETGRSFPSLGTLEKLVNVLKIDLADIFDYPYKNYSTAKLRKLTKDMIDEADESKLRLLVKLIRDVVR